MGAASAPHKRAKIGKKDMKRQGVVAKKTKPLGVIFELALQFVEAIHHRNILAVVATYHSLLL